MAVIVDGAELHVVSAALSLYRSQLSHGRVLGGDARETADVFDPIAARVETRIHDELFGPDEPAVPEWDLGNHYVGVGR